MARSLIIVEEAAKEFLDAYEWYEARQSGLGPRFAECFRECLKKIEQNPMMAQAIRSPYRWGKIPHFPYVVIFEFDAETLRNYSVFHCSRDAAKWQKPK